MVGKRSIQGHGSGPMTLNPESIILRGASIRIIWLALAGFPPASRSADWLTFARGGTVDLPAATVGATIVVEAPGGDRTFPTRAFRSVLPSSRWEDDWRDRWSEGERSGTARGWLEAGWWALERGLPAEAIEAFRFGLRCPGSPTVAPLRRAGRLLAQLDEESEPGELTRIMAELGGSGWIEAGGRHVVLLHQGQDPVAATERLDVLDRVVATYYLSLAIQGLELKVPSGRLISIWFARQADYVAFLHRVGAGPFANTQGYYHPTHRAVVAFDTRSGADQMASRRAIERLRDASPGEAERVELDRQLFLLDLDWRGVDLGIAAHETIHQLVAASGLAGRFDDFPNWLHEGFSAQFEVVRDGRWAGFGRTNDRRIADWRALRNRPRIASLLRDDGLTHGYRRDRYAESWALVYFLRKTRPAEFVDFLHHLQTPRPAGRPAASADAFEAAFGPDFDRLERDWHAFMAEQRTPLEARARQSPK